MLGPTTLLNLGCGDYSAPGWLNLDVRQVEGVDLRCDVRKGIPLCDGCIDYTVGMHVLQDVPWKQIPAVLSELRRVLKRGGVLRLGLPDLDRAIDAYLRGDARYFYVPDSDARSIGGKLITQIIWYGSNRTPFTYDFACELLHNAEFVEVRRCAFRQTATGNPDIIALDNRERETFFVEAVK
jgi:SAM-dependent methyltransferase